MILSFSINLFLKYQLNLMFLFIQKYIVFKINNHINIPQACVAISRNRSVEAYNKAEIEKGCVAANFCECILK